MRVYMSFVLCCTFMFLVKYGSADPMRCSKPNEILDCMSPCAEKTCQTRNTECTKESFGICRVKCVCKNGFYRDTNDNCISVKDCDYQVHRS
ncbi:PREDICTED: chymotrypsin inhibitor-like [Papilio xuthus]|uniref:Chymotrypsin inhibitor-like n=1 Tax=Papilio xuthus TaxID=66420 RepID=I4DPJ1_PAPXU|nr:PREDICTED: chymotrypsin inhibitor-like [Papilio xuthus]BAM19831.1 unknown secreted protein [Papilio xuthus]